MGSPWMVRALLATMAAALSGCTLLSGFGEFRADGAADMGARDSSVEPDSGLDAGPTDAGDVDANDADVPLVRLTVRFSSGSDAEVGTGTVLNSQPSGLVCTATGCELSVRAGSSVLLRTVAWASVSNWGTGVCASGPTCALVLTTDTTLTITPVALGNLAFVTSIAYPIAAGPVLSVPAADAECGVRAAAAGLPGTYVALIGPTRAERLDHVPAGNPGWIRLDGRVAVRVGVTIDPSISRLVHPIDVDENGGTVPVNYTAIAYIAPAPNCPGPILPTLGLVHATDAAFVSDSGSIPCSALLLSARLYCLRAPTRAFDPLPEPSVDPDAVYVFITENGASSRTDNDTACATEAAAARLPGSYRALLGDSTTAPLSIVARPDAALRRADHHLLALRASDFLSETTLFTAPSQHADGTPHIDLVMTGFALFDPRGSSSLTETCRDWTSTSGSDVFGATYCISAARPGAVGNPDAYARLYSSYSRVLALGCDMPQSVYCIRTD